MEGGASWNGRRGLLKWKALLHPIAILSPSKELSRHRWVTEGIRGISAWVAFGWPFSPLMALRWLWWGLRRTWAVLSGFSLAVLELAWAVLLKEEMYHLAVTPSHDLSAVGGSRWEGRATLCADSAGRIWETSVEILFWAFWSRSVPCLHWWFQIQERKWVPRRAIGSGPHLFAARAIRPNNWVFKAEAECNPAGHFLSSPFSTLTRHDLFSRGSRLVCATEQFLLVDKNCPDAPAVSQLLGAQEQCRISCPPPPPRSTQLESAF